MAKLQKNFKKLKKHRLIVVALLLLLIGIIGLSYKINQHRANSAPVTPVAYINKLANTIQSQYFDQAKALHDTPKAEDITKACYAETPNPGGEAYGVHDNGIVCSMSVYKYIRVKADGAYVKNLFFDLAKTTKTQNYKEDNSLPIDYKNADPSKNISYKAQSQDCRLSIYYSPQNAAYELPGQTHIDYKNTLLYNLECAHNLTTKVNKTNVYWGACIDVTPWPKSFACGYKEYLNHPSKTEM